MIDRGKIPARAGEQLFSRPGVLTPENLKKMVTSIAQKPSFSSIMMYILGKKVL